MLMFQMIGGMALKALKSLFASKYRLFTGCMELMLNNFLLFIDNEEYFTYRSCSTSKPLKGKWRISQDTLFLEGEHRLFPFYFVIKNDNKMVHKGKLRSGPFIEIMRRE